jgi:putative membrane protein insertion efficiency factor
MKKIAIALLRVYKWALSPLLPAACRYVPSCSDYAVEAVEHYGALLGGIRAAWRVLRCHPFARGGYDPVLIERATLHDAGGRPHAN